ncbi:MAG TPA: hypothetical protein VE325_08055 [Burkholderiales bacterium]|jgi:hypothetical protein|nr:hypothetical protein [Burkholderiales bacterium]
MNPVVEGALIGLGIGVALVFFEYLLLSQAVNERAKKLNRRAVFDVTERRRMTTIMRFALVLPVGFAAAFWLIWG